MLNFNSQKLALKTLLMKITNNLYTFSQQQINLLSLLSPLLKSQKQSSLLSQQNNTIKLIDKIKYMQIFYKTLKNVVNQWIDLLINDGIQCQTLIININNSTTLTILYDGMITQINQQINKEQHVDIFKIFQRNNANNTNKAINFQQIFIDTTNKSIITQILNIYAKQIVDCYKYGKLSIKHYIQKIDNQIKKNEIMNTYIAFGMLKQMSVQVEQQILKNIKDVIENINQQKCMEFIKYIQKNYQFVDFAYIQNNYMFSKQELKEYQHLQNNKWLEYIKEYVKYNIQVEHIESVDGDPGILLTKKISKNVEVNQNLLKDQQVKQTPIKQQKKVKKNSQQKHKEKSSGKKQNKQEEDKNKKQQDQKLILKIQNGNQIKVINAKICQKSWKIFQTKNSIDQLYQMLKNKIEQSQNSKAKQYVSYGIPTCEQATIGGSLGKCLADIDKYDDANQFFVDLSKTAAICSTFSYAMAEVPILSYFIVAGGFSYSFYLTCSNKATSAHRKANQIGNATFTVFGSVGSTLAGILLGQAVIPVPFLGGFIGGVVGGFLGTKGVTRMNDLLSQSNFRDIIAYIKLKLIADRYWKCTKYMLQRIGLDQKYFYKHTPVGQLNKDIYITVICFCIVTFYQAKRNKEFTQKKLKEHKQKMQKKEQNNSKFEINRKTQKNKDKQNSTQPQIQISQEIHKNTQKQHKKVDNEIEQQFSNQFNIVKIVEFLTQNKFIVLDHLDQIQNFICHLVG